MYRLHSKQGQRGIQEAQSRAKSEYGVADEDDFHFGEKSKERILRGIGLLSGQKHKKPFKVQIFRNDSKQTINMLKSQTITDGWQDVYVERNHNQQETSEKQKRDFISERLIEPPSNWRPHDEPESCENLQTTLKRENSSNIKYVFVLIVHRRRRIRSFPRTVNQRLFIIFHGAGRNGGKQHEL